MKIFRPGASVKIGPVMDRITATVHSILIEPENSVSYKLAWWDGKTRREEWLPAHEIYPDEHDSQHGQIGFH
ncbi:MAG: hypothetical protein ACWGQW_04710 [bacterium]